MGDAVIRLLMAKLLWENDRATQVGDWSAVRAALVSDRTLADLAQIYGLQNYLIIGPSAMGDPKGESSRLADAFEALLGALYLSTQDLTLIEPWLTPKLQERAATVRADPAYQNYKAALQQWTQAHFGVLPEYRVQDTHQLSDTANEDQRFAAEVWIKGDCLGTGAGRTIKAAEKAAAEEAFLQLSSI